MDYWQAQTDKADDSLRTLCRQSTRRSDTHLERPMTRAKRKKKARKGVTVKAWCMVNELGKVVKFPTGRLAIFTSRHLIVVGIPRRCRVIVG